MNLIKLFRLILCALYGALAFAQADEFTDPLSAASFAPGPNPPAVPLQGNVTLWGQRLSVYEHVRQSWLPEVSGELPLFEFDIVNHSSALIPVQREYRVTNHEVFDYFISPGQAWTDGTHSYGSLPFTLIHRWTNCTHNGLVRFRYTESTIDDVAFLVNQETCHFLKFDMWGSGTSVYRPRPVPSAANIRQSYDVEAAHRIPSRPLSELTSIHESMPDWILFDLPVNDDLTTAGVLIDDVNYTAGCRTRSEPYPYCDYMFHTSFSTAKTAYAAMALMRMAQIYGLEVYDAAITDYLPEAYDGQGNWRDVTFDHVGDMTSGHYLNADPMADPAPGNFYGLLDRAGKLEAAFSWPKRTTPGTKFVYQTADTFILVSALDSYLKQHESPIVDSYDLVYEHIYKPLHLAPEMQSTRRTADRGAGNSGTAFGGMGMWWNRDSVAKIGKFLLTDGGAIGGEQVLHPEALAQTLQQSEETRGIATGIQQIRYNNGTWLSPESFETGRRGYCRVQVPFMSGLSGVRVYLIPNGVVVYFFNDVQSFPSANQVYAAHMAIPICEPSSDSRRRRR